MIFTFQDYGDEAKGLGLVLSESETILGFYVILLYVNSIHRDNVRCVDDLVNVNRIGVAEPRVSPAGLEAIYIINQSRYRDEIIKRIVIAKDKVKLVERLRIKAVDAAFI
uniref:Uncharacterized protein n=1 Tax=Ignisphaera aggregans TaxID=334771 RepID=A0A7J3QE45_9CREN